MQASNQYDYALRMMQSISRCVSEMTLVLSPRLSLEIGSLGSLGELVDESL
jgi:hypothetical protein